MTSEPPPRPGGLRQQPSTNVARHDNSRRLHSDQARLARHTRGALSTGVSGCEGCVVRVTLGAAQRHAAASERAGCGREAAGRLVRRRAVEGELRGAARLVRHPPVALLLHAEAAAHAQLVHL